MPMFYKQSKGGASKNSHQKSTSHTTFEASTQGGLNLNEEADDSEEEFQEVRPMRPDKVKKKVSASRSHCEASAVVAPKLVAMLTAKWLHEIKVIFSHKKEALAEYLRIKEHEWEMERLRLAQRD